MDINIKLSIVIVFDDQTNNIKRTMESVLKQSLKEIEVICFSLTNSGKVNDVLKEFAGNDSRVRYENKEGMTVGAARNAAIKTACGEYIHFLHENDAVLNYAYEALYNKMNRYTLDAVRFCGHAVNGNKKNTLLHEDYLLTELRVGDFNKILSKDSISPLYNLFTAIGLWIFRLSSLKGKEICFDDLNSFDERLFFAKLHHEADRLLAARDHLIIHDVKKEDTVTANEYDDLKKAVRNTEQYLLEKKEDTQSFEKILSYDFDLMLDACKKLINEKNAEEVLSSTKEFIGSFHYGFIRGVFNNFKKVYYARNRLITNPVKASEQYEEIRVYYDRCNAPKVSVVVPIFNQEEYLNEALHSLVTQKLEEIELVCVNDGSTDQSMVILKEYEDLDKRIRIIDKKNTGYGNSMNVGIDASTGEYLGILEPDDYVPAGMFSALYKTAARNDLEMVKADFYRFWINADGSTKRRLFRLTSDNSYYGRIVNTSEELETFRFTMNTWSGIYKLSFLNQYHIRHNETPGASYQDNGFWFQTFTCATKAWFVNKPYYMNRRDNPNSSMYNKGKFYAVTNEYKFIWDYLNKDPKMMKKYESIYYYRKFINFKTTYQRIDTKYKKDYLYHLRDEFKPVLEQGKLKEDLFGILDWKLVNEMVSDPDAYYDKIRVSVIIPAYNAEDYIGECLDSILVRDEIRMEVICVDDGSKDNTLSILKEYEAKDARVRVIAQENAGAGGARNNGMKAAKGEYLCFLDADDFFDPEMIRRAYERSYIDENDITVYRSDQYIESTKEYTDLSYTIREDLLPEKRPFAGTEIFMDTFKAFVGWPWDKIFRAEFVRENNLQFQPLRTTNDMLFVFSAVVKAERISILNEVLAHHRRLNAGTLSVSREKSWQCFYMALTALKKQLIEWDMYEDLEQDFINYVLHSSLWNLNSLKGDAYYKLYAKLKEEWFDEMGVSDKDELYFFNPEEYRQLEAIKELTAEDFLIYRRDTANQTISELRIIEKESRWMENYIEKIENRLEKTKDKFEDMKASVSYRTGRAITSAPRKVRDAFKKVLKK